MLNVNKSSLCYIICNIWDMPSNKLRDFKYNIKIQFFCNSIKNSDIYCHHGLLSVFLLLAIKIYIDKIIQIYDQWKRICYSKR